MNYSFFVVNLIKVTNSYPNVFICVGNIIIPYSTGILGQNPINLRYVAKLVVHKGYGYDKKSR